MRDLLKDKNYFSAFINSEIERYNKFNNWISEGRTPSERIPYVKNNIIEIKIAVLVAYYSSNNSFDNLNKILLDVINLMDKSWVGFWKLKNSKGKELDQYILSAYDEMLWMLSLSFLLDVPNSEFKKLVNVVDKDGVKDKLFEFIIRAKLPEREVILNESYQEFLEFQRFLKSYDWQFQNLKNPKQNYK